MELTFNALILKPKRSKGKKSSPKQNGSSTMMAWFASSKTIGVEYCRNVSSRRFSLQFYSTRSWRALKTMLSINHEESSMMPAEISPNSSTRHEQSKLKSSRTLTSLQLKSKNSSESRRDCSRSSWKQKDQWRTHRRNSQAKLHSASIGAMGRKRRL